MAIAKRCQHYDLVSFNYYGGPKTICQNLATGEGPHGWLCADHKAENEQRRPIHRVNTPVRDLDEELVQGIIASEQRELHVHPRLVYRFGIIEPIFLHIVDKQ
jgi:hypothetical protein